MLELDAVNVFIQGSHILRDVSLRVEPGALVCLVGRNGAGKTTILRTVMGYLRPASGRIGLGGEAIAGLPTHAIARRGVGYAPEEGGIFGDLTVAENVEIATWTRPEGRPAAERIELAYQVFPTLRRYAARGGTHLSGGERKMLAIARALALDPQAPAPRRALRGPVPGDRSAGGREHRRHRPPGSVYPPGRVERAPRATRDEPSLRHRARRDHLRRARGRRPPGPGGPACGRRSGHPLTPVAPGAGTRSSDGQTRPRTSYVSPRAGYRQLVSTSTRTPVVRPATPRSPR